jgi:hypothetical protein
VGSFIVERFLHGAYLLENNRIECLLATSKSFASWPPVARKRAANYSAMLTVAAIVLWL